MARFSMPKVWRGEDKLLEAIKTGFECDPSPVSAEQMTEEFNSGGGIPVVPLYRIQRNLYLLERIGWLTSNGKPGKERKWWLEE